MTKITNNSEVILDFIIKLEDGSVAENSLTSGKSSKLIMGDGSLTENFEKCLLGLSEGEKGSFTLEPGDAFGLPNADNIHHMSKSLFSEDVPAQEGVIIAFSGPLNQDIPGVITQVVGDSVTVDFNHPLAGRRIIFDVNIIRVCNL